MKIEYLIRRNYLTANPYSGLLSIKKQLLENIAIVVQDEENFIGVLTTKDISMHPKTLIIDCLSDKPMIDCNYSIEKTLSFMNEDDTDVLPAMKKEKFIGLIYKKDLINYMNEYKTELEHKIKESTLELQKAVAMKDMMYSIVAHDLRNPFNTIIGFTDLLIQKMRTYSIDKIENQIVHVNQQAKIAYKLLENLLNWSVSQLGSIIYHPVACNINLISEEVIEQLRPSAELKRISLIGFHSENNCAIADKNMVETILRNLISNAIKFTENDGRIDIYSNSNHEFIEISISDNGIGLSDEQISDLFQLEHSISRLGTSKEKGLGLGLIICKELVEKNGGKIWIEKKTEKGAEFKFTLPKMEC